MTNNLKNITFNLFDSFGNGWNGGYINVENIFY